MSRGAIVLLIATAVSARVDAREFCPDRPEHANPPCVIEPGRAEAEASFVDWSLTRAAGAGDDQFLIGDLLVRTGLSQKIEARLGVTSYGFTRSRSGGRVDRAQGVGDASIGLRWNLRHPDGSRGSVALQPTVTLPTGGTAIGAGTWAFALALPASVDLGRSLTLGFTPEVDAAANADRRGRHLAYSGALVLGVPLTEKLEAAAEVYGALDEAPDSLERASVDLSLAAKIGPETQLDASSYVGLTRDTPDIQAIVGVAHRF